MRFVSVRREENPTWGLVVGDGFVDLGARHPHLPTLRSAIEAQQLAALASDSNDPDVELDRLQLDPVVPDARQIFCVGLNYEKHRIETERDASAHPSIFLRYPSSLAAHGAALVKPAGSEKFDYEGELAVVIGNGGRHIDEEDALGHIAGYALFDDGSARDWQRHTSQWTPGKNFPQTGALGPELVTPDEVGGLEGSALVTRVNGEERQRALIGEMTFPISVVISYVSSFIELLPGDVIATGTPGGVGSRMEPPRFLSAGDEVEVEIDRVGVLHNRVVEEQR